MSSEEAYAKALIREAWEAYAEASRRICEAKDTGATSLDLSHLKLLILPQELERLKSLQTLNLSNCEGLLSDLSPLAGLTSLQTLDGATLRLRFYSLAMEERAKPSCAAGCGGSHLMQAFPPPTASSSAK